MLAKIDCFIVGTGLSDNENLLRQTADYLVEHVFKAATCMAKCVFDADSFRILPCLLPFIQQQKNFCIATPNQAELKHLLTAFSCSSEMQLHQTLGMPMLCKGSADLLYANGTVTECSLSSAGSQRRCGGQGDLLAGCLAAKLCAKKYLQFILLPASFIVLIFLLAALQVLCKLGKQMRLLSKG